MTKEKSSNTIWFGIKKINMSAKCQGCESVCPFSEHFTYSTEAWVPILTDNLWEHMLI